MKFPFTFPSRFRLTDYVYVPAPNRTASVVVEVRSASIPSESHATSIGGES